MADLLQRQSKDFDDEEDEHPGEEDQQNGSEEGVDFFDVVVDQCVALVPLAQPAIPFAVQFGQVRSHVFDDDLQALGSHIRQIHEQDDRQINVQIADFNSGSNQDVPGCGIVRIDVLVAQNPNILFKNRVDTCKTSRNVVRHDETCLNEVPTSHEQIKSSYQEERVLNQLGFTRIIKKTTVAEVATAILRSWCRRAAGRLINCSIRCTLVQKGLHLTLMTATRMDAISTLVMMVVFCLTSFTQNRMVLRSSSMVIV